METPKSREPKKRTTEEIKEIQSLISSIKPKKKSRELLRIFQSGQLDELSKNPLEDIKKGIKAGRYKTH